MPLILGVVAGPTQVGLFRIAQTPQTGLAGASSPARLVLMTEQTRDWEKGERSRILAGLRSYSKWAGALMVVAVPVFFVAMPWLVEVVFGSEYDGAVDAARIVLIAAAIHFVIGWTKTLPVTIGRPRLRIVTHGLETLVAIPLVAVLGSEWGATGAAVGVLVSTVVFALAWLVVLVRLRDEVQRPSARTRRRSSREGRRRLGDLATGSRRSGEPRARGRRLPGRAGARRRGRDDGRRGAGGAALPGVVGCRAGRRCGTCARRGSCAPALGRGRRVRDEHDPARGDRRPARTHGRSS